MWTIQWWIGWLLIENQISVLTSILGLVWVSFCTKGNNSDRAPITSLSPSFHLRSYLCLLLKLLKFLEQFLYFWEGIPNVRHFVLKPFQFPLHSKLVLKQNYPGFTSWLCFTFSWESTTSLNLRSYVFFIYYLYIFCSCTFALISWFFLFGKINKIILLIDKWKNRYLLPFPFLVSSSTLICLDGESSFLNSTLQTQVSVYLPMTCCHSYTSWSTYQFKFLLKLP